MTPPSNEDLPELALTQGEIAIAREGLKPSKNHSLKEEQLQQYKEQLARELRQRTQKAGGTVIDFASRKQKD